MPNESLQKFIEGVRKIWGPLTSETVNHCRELVDELVKTPPTERWLQEILHESFVEKELYRDPDHGFILLAHTEKVGLYRPPHDHGTGWVIYVVQNGETEMGTFSRVIDHNGKLNLVRRESYRMHKGDSRVYLPGDIHDTKCISDSVLMIRFSSCDIKKENQEGRMIRYS